MLYHWISMPINHWCWILPLLKVAGPASVQMFGLLCRVPGSHWVGWWPPLCWCGISWWRWNSSSSSSSWSMTWKFRLAQPKGMKCLCFDYLGACWWWLKYRQLWTAFLCDCLLDVQDEGLEICQPWKISLDLNEQWCFLRVIFCLGVDHYRLWETCEATILKKVGTTLVPINLDIPMYYLSR